MKTTIYIILAALLLLTVILTLLYVTGKRKFTAQERTRNSYVKKIDNEYTVVIKSKGFLKDTKK